MNNTLFLDDEEHRHEVAARRYPGARHVRTARQAVDALGQEQFDLISLDHDLADWHYTHQGSTDESTGLYVAEWLANHPEASPDATIIVHSWNPAGAGRMLAVLHAAGRRSIREPFSIRG